ncbi:MAG: glycosyltransferase family 1 protein [Magnetococcales bacterium]|nr:glycosyltransferase family 1 protein [Magnetococcales bacterium]
MNRSPYLEEVRRLEEQDDIEGLIDLVQSSQHLAQEMQAALWQLLPAMQIRPAYLTAMLLANLGHRHPIIFMTLCLGGHQYHNPIEERRGFDGLASLVGSLSPAQQEQLNLDVVYPVMVHLLRAQLADPAGEEGMPRILDILRGTDPRFHAMFDRNAPAPAIDLERMRQRGRERARLVQYALPPAGVPRVARSAMIATWGIGDELGLRMTLAMRSYGWLADFMSHPPTLDPATGCRAIAERCVQARAEVLILALDHVIGHDGQPYRELCLFLRQSQPACKVVGVLFDTWGGRAAGILAPLQDVLDGVWSHDLPTLPLWDSPALAGKVLRANPLPVGGAFPVSTAPLLPMPLFSGSIQGWNWPRAFWRTAIWQAGLPCRTEYSSSLFALRLTPEENHASFLAYMRRISEATCCLNLTMRQNLEYVVTCRAFDVPLSGALLLQESTPDMDCYFIAGEHYLEFSSIAELTAVVRFLTEQPDAAEEIRRAGHAFARERYGDDKLIGYLDHLLFAGQ